MVRMAPLLQAMLAAGLLIGCATTPRTPQQQAADRQTAAAVRAALAAQPYLFAEHVTVAADDGVVHLGGRIFSDWDMYAVERVARSVPGVSGIVNQMDLPRESGDDSVESE